MVTDLDQSPYGVLIAQGICEPIQGLERTTHKALTLLQSGDNLLSGLTFAPFVIIEHNLHPERRMPTHLEGDMAPVGIDQMKVIHIRPKQFTGQVGCTFVVMLGLPH